jgi:hypothetical protein
MVLPLNNMFPAGLSPAGNILTETKIAGRVRYVQRFLIFENKCLNEMSNDALMDSFGIHIDNGNQLIATGQACHNVEP